MKLGIMQPYFFPYIGYFQLISAVDKFILYDQVAYIKNGWIHRNRISELHRGDIYFGVPVRAKSSNLQIAEIEIAPTGWQQQLCTLLHHNYRRTPHYKLIFPFLENLLNVNCHGISELNHHTIVAVARLLEIPTEIVWDGPKGWSFENAIRSRAVSENIKVERILSICKRESASQYVNSIGGSRLYQREAFLAAGVELSFVAPAAGPGGLHPNLTPPYRSIIDTLFWCGIAGTQELLNKYRLV